MNLAGAVLHHEKILASRTACITDWAEKIQGNRCPACWLRLRQCHCDYLQPRKEQYTTELLNCPAFPEFIMYYHFRELGRSANTAHIFDAILGCKKIVFGDLEAEEQLADEIAAEYHCMHRDGEVSSTVTIILYPSRDSKGINEWTQGRRSLFLDPTRWKSAARPRTRCVLLDGTYSDAEKIIKHMEKLIRIRGAAVPLVKLDLEGGKCSSSMLGIMYQPSPEKICTFQAAVMAASQLAESCIIDMMTMKPFSYDRQKVLGSYTTLIRMLEEDLNRWVEYILEKKIKFGKVKKKSSNKVVDMVPSEIVMSHLTNNPPNVGVMKLRDSTTNNLFVPTSYNVSEEESGVKIIVRKSPLVDKCFEDISSLSIDFDDRKSVRIVQTKRFCVYSLG